MWNKEHRYSHQSPGWQADSFSCFVTVGSFLSLRLSFLSFNPCSWHPLKSILETAERRLVWPLEDSG